MPVYKPKNAKTIVLDWLNDLEILVITCRKHFNQYVKENGLESDRCSKDWEASNGSCLVIEDDGLEYYTVLIVAKEPRVICHEAVHMAHYICNAKGIPLSMENTETIAYLTDHIFKNIMKICRMK